MAKHLREIVEGKYTYKTDGPKPKDKPSAWSKRVMKTKITAKKKQEYASSRQRQEMSKKHPELAESELDEARRKPVKKNYMGSMKPDVKTQSQLKKEKAERMKSIRAAIKQKKETGEKITFRKSKDWRQVRASAKRKIRE